MAGVLLLAGGMVGLRATWTAAAPAPLPSVQESARFVVDASATSVPILDHQGSGANDVEAGVMADAGSDTAPGAPPTVATAAGSARDGAGNSAASPTTPRLRIAAIGVDAPLEAHALGAATWQGQQVSALVLPKDPSRLTRWGGGADPCQRPSAGTVLISGHVAAGGLRGALWSLAESQPGATAKISCPDGSVTTWRQVGGAGSSAKTELPQDFFAGDGPLRLVTVTCGGRVLADGHYESNVWAIWEPAPSG